jgi:uncharacterized Zn finger protein
MTPAAAAADISTDTFDKGIRLHQEGRVLTSAAHLGHLYVVVAGDTDVYLVHLYLEDEKPVTGLHRCSHPHARDDSTCSHIIAALAAWARGQLASAA